MPQFILIDNSIKDTNGHYFQYAVHCLSAAEKIGYTPILATNKKFAKTKDITFKTFPIYTYEFFTTNEKKRIISEIYKKIATKIYHLKYKTIFSEVGLIWENRHNLNNLLKHQLPNEKFLRNPISTLILAFFTVPSYLIVSKSVNILQRLSQRYQNTLVHSLLSAEPIDPITASRLDKNKTNAFYQETEKVFKKITLNEEDVVFIPTVGGTELLGLFEYLIKDKRSLNATWHLLFRRNIYDGREEDYQKQDERLRPLRNMLFFFVQGLKNHRVYFYTDTEELTIQYNRLGATDFKTLPIPHTIPQNDTSMKNPLTITYIGDARTEKGYQYLPRIVDDLWADYVKDGKIRFIFQSNYNVPSGEPKIVIARSQLESHPKDRVELIYKPLSLAKYQDLFLQSNIVLLPYDSANYYARSSGILAECLAAGIPVIVPAATWLSRQFSKETYTYHLELIKYVVEEHSMSSTMWHPHGFVDKNAIINDKLMFGGEKTKVYCRLKRPSFATHILITIEIENKNGTNVGIDIVQTTYDFIPIHVSSNVLEKIDDSYMSCVVPLKEDAPLLWIGLKNPFGEKIITANNVNIRLINLEKNEPISSVGCVYNNPEEISIMLKNIIDNYEHYRRTALNFSKKYFRMHNADTLVKQIIDTSKS